MKTVTLNIQDSFLNRFFEFVDHHKEEITVSKDPFLTLDPYYYERVNELQELTKEVDEGSMELVSQKEYEEEMAQFFQKLKT